MPPKKKSKAGLFIGIGCLALVVLVACVAVALALAPKILDRDGGSVSMATAVVPPREGGASATATPRSGGIFGGGASGTIATPAAPSGDGIARGELLYSDDFADDESGWDIREADDASTVYRNGAYHIIVNDIDWVAWGNPYSYFTDFVLDVDATQVSGPDDNDFGVLVRYVDVDNFYRFEISGDGYYSFDLMQDDEWVTLINWTESPAIRQGEATNTITIVCVGDLFTFYVNGEYLDEYRDGTFPSGDIGLLAGTISDGPVHIAFDNVKVWSLP